MALIEDDAQRHAVPAAGRDRLFAFPHRDRQRLLDQRMLAGRRRRDRVLRVQSVRRRVVERIDVAVAQHVVEGRMDPGNAVFTGEGLAARAVAAQDRDQLGIEGLFQLRHDASFGMSAGAEQRPMDGHGHFPRAIRRLRRATP